MNKFVKALTLGLLLSAGQPLWAAKDNSPVVPTVKALSWTDTHFLTEQRKRVDRLTRENFGTPIRGNKTDLRTLQRVIDRELIAKKNTMAQQALGVVLGDVMHKTEPTLQWRVYEDKHGHSRALCIAHTLKCLFPVTMLSRRMAVGLKPKVNKIFLDALNLMAKELPEKPYGGKRHYSAN